MKLLGALLAFAGCAAIGLERVRAAKRRIHALSALVDSLSMMKSELAARLVPIPELTACLAAHGKDVAGRFFSALRARMDEIGSRALSDLWEECAEATLDMLQADERGEFAALGSLIGRCELDAQLAAIEGCLLAERAALARAREEYPQCRRLSLGLSAAAGLMLITVLY